MFTLKLSYNNMDKDSGSKKKKNNKLDPFKF